MNDINVFGVERTGASTTADFRVKDSFIINALRNCGYTVYTALADIADNSIEPEVESNNVWFDYDYEKTNKGPIITGIYLIDDGNGMPMDILQEAMCLGSETGKNGEDNLGLYGAGLKAAAHIDKELHTHIARKSYATLLMNKDVPISTITKCMGHSNSTITTRVYAFTEEDTIARQVGSINLS